MIKQCLSVFILFIALTIIILLTGQAQAIQQKPAAVAALPSQFTGKSAGIDIVLLAWKQTDETNILSFELQRSTDGTNFTPVLLMHTKGASKKPNGYAYTDANLQSGCYFYRLRTETFNGQETYSPILQIALKDGTTLPTETARL